MLEVLRVLNHHIIPSPSTAPTTTATSAPTTPRNCPVAATYASAARRTTSPVTAENNMLKQSDFSRPSSPPTFPHATGKSPRDSSPTRVVVRFDRQATQNRPPPTQVCLTTIYLAVDKALSGPIGGSGFLAGAQWTQNGNLVLHPALDFCTAKFIAEQCDLIWAVIRPLMGLKEKHPCPIFDTDEKWHTVVFHGVPMPAARRTEAFTPSIVRAWAAPRGEVMGHSVLCRPEDFQTRRSVALRVSLSSEADAQKLIENGGYMLGARCRVSRYVEKPRKAPSMS
ncbi:hypothetical protein B0H17DRAFT_1070275 [Mycena rosella]|uniref:Uncharacterized protein n=1 Tax=Mycena rosella TaxID=1033263 RepID=A0AAD7DCW7_MYCRO|nr:hypothetical protein B0H17DRAFT_1070275 [Mycena rosella]